MKYKYYKSIDKNLSVIGFDTSHFSKQSNKHFNKDECVNLLKDAIKKGVNYINTSPLFGLGQAEIIVGEAILDVPRDSIFISSKLGYAWDETLIISENLSQDSIYEQIELSLRRLNIDYLDLCLFDLPVSHENIRETINALINLKNDGLIKNIGVCDCAARQLNDYIDSGIIDIYQGRCSPQIHNNLIFIPQTSLSNENLYSLISEPWVGPILTRFADFSEITDYNNFIDSLKC